MQIREVGGQFGRIGDYIISAPGAYIQRNPNIPDYLEGFIKASTQFPKAGQAATYSKIHAILAVGKLEY